MKPFRLSAMKKSINLRLRNRGVSNTEMIFADSVKLEIVFSNFLSNALKVSQEIEL